MRPSILSKFNSLLIAITLTFLCSLSASTQESLPDLIKDKRVKRGLTIPPPCGIKLLDGYVHIPLQGIDSWFGRIKKEGRLTITYDIGYLAGEYADNCFWNNSCLWYKEQQFNGGLLKISLSTDGIVSATFPKTYANFYAEVKTQEDIAEFLLIIMTYDEKQECGNHTSSSAASELLNKTMRQNAFNLTHFPLGMSLRRPTNR